MELLAIPIALWALLATLEQTQLTKNALTEQRISSAWQILAIPTGGTSGKVHALTTLVDLEQDVIGIDLGCGDANGLILDANEPACSSPVDLQGIEFGNSSGEIPTKRFFIDSSNFGRANFREADFGYAEVANSKFIDSDLRNANLVGSFVGTDFSGSKMELTLVGGHFSEVSFAGISTYKTHFDEAFLSNIDFTNADLTGAIFHEADYWQGVSFGPTLNVSGARFCREDTTFHVLDWRRRTGSDAWFRPPEEPSCNPTLSQALIDHMWYYADNPPIDLFLLHGELRIHSGCTPGGVSMEEATAGNLLFVVHSDMPAHCFEQHDVELKTVIPPVWRRPAR